MSSSEKRRHKTLSAKVEIINNSEKLVHLAKHYDVGHSTIYIRYQEKIERRLSVL
jgi:hypothetical protein